MNKFVSYLLRNCSQAELARHLDVSRHSISKWLHESQPIPIKVALKIHAYTHGEIKYYEIRPDLPKIKC